MGTPLEDTAADEYIWALEQRNLQQAIDLKECRNLLKTADHRFPAPGMIPPHELAEWRSKRDSQVAQLNTDNGEGK